MNSLEKLKILTPFQNAYVIGLGKVIVAAGFEKFLKSNKLPNLVTLYGGHHVS